MFATEIQPAELKTAIAQAVATGQAGALVSARLHWQVPTAHELVDAALIAAELVDSVLQLEAPQWRVRRSELGSLLHAMGTDVRGRTLVLTLNHGPTADAQLTLFGNHGVIRLDRAELCCPAPRGMSESAVSQSLRAALQMSAVAELV